MSEVYKYYATIFGRNATVYWKTAIEALIWKAIYNLWHNIKRDGKCITKINKFQYVHQSDNNQRRQREYQNSKQENRERGNIKGR